MSDSKTLSEKTPLEANAPPAPQEQTDRPLTPEEEIAELEKLLSQEPDDFQARCRLGELYFSQGRLDEALAEVKKSIEMAEGLRTEMDRSLAMYYSNLGTIYGTKGMMDDAAIQFRRALELNKYDVLALFNLGRLHCERKEYLQAKDYFERLIEITPDDPIAWYNLAGVYEKLDDPQVSDYNTLDMAIQAYMKVLELDPHHLECSFKLMDIALNLKKPELAIKVMEEAVAQNPDEPLAYYNLINTYEKCKMFDLAEETRQKLKDRFAKRSREAIKS
ncbi:MAG: tetratricopeptide repeat protein [Nitrospirae bacterium]|nr:MAG: tetratricopeptide repeat protein [Nitrospirota bacterium]